MSFKKPLLVFIIIIASSYFIGFIFKGFNSKKILNLEDTGIENKREQNENNKFNN